jgi:hypothetical protein
MPDELKVGSREWWLARLARQLRERSKANKIFEDYYEGEHPLAFASEKFRSAFGDLFGELADNWCPLVVDAVEERLNIRGFRIPESDTAEAIGPGDQDAWRIWQSNQLDLFSQIGHTESLIGAVAYALVWAGEDESIPAITIEHPAQMIVENYPGTTRRAAALKVWRDDWTGRLLATLYLPDEISKWQSTTRRRSVLGDRVAWEPRVVEDEEWPLPNPLDVVPVVPLENKPRLLKPGVSELKPVIPIQDAVNKLVADLLVGSEEGAQRRRWATGIEIPRDPKTGQEIETFEKAVGRLWHVKAKDAQFGDFQVTELSNFVSAIEMFVQHCASQTRTPPHYFFLRGEFPSGESIKSAETGLVAKTLRKMVYYGESWEEVIRLAFAVLEDRRSRVRTSETIWADPESRSESEHIDAVLKKKALGVPAEQLWEDAGYSPTQITRFKEQIAEEALTAATSFDPFAAVPSANGGGGGQGAVAGAGAGAGAGGS